MVLGPVLVNYPRSLKHWSVTHFQLYGYELAGQTGKSLERVADIKTKMIKAFIVNYLFKLLCLSQESS